MALYMLATIRRDFTEITKIRLYDTVEKQVKDFMVGSIVQALNTNPNVAIQNLGLNNTGEYVVGLNGSLDNYVKIIDGIGVVGPSTVVIVKKYLNGDFEVVNGVGQSERMSEESLIKYAETEGLANGSVCTSKNGKKFIRSIQGEFELEKEKDVQKLRQNVERKVSMLGGGKFSLNEHGHFMYKDKTAKKVKVPEGIEVLGKGCFFDCKELTEVILPSTLKEIKGFAFERCTSLKELKLPYGFQKLSDNEFADSYIEKIYLPMSIVDTGVSLMKAPKLKTVYFVNRNLRRQLKVRDRVRLEFITNY